MAGNNVFQANAAQPIKKENEVHAMRKNKKWIAAAVAAALVVTAGAAFAAGSKVGTRYEGPDREAVGPGINIQTETGAAGDAASGSDGAVSGSQNAETIGPLADPNVSVNANGSTGTSADASDGDASVLNEKNPVREYGTIGSIDTENKQVVFEAAKTDENGNDAGKEEIVLHILDGTPIVDAATGLPVALSDLKAGSAAYAWHSQAMTRSLPPQTNAIALVVNIPADFAAPQYVVVQSVQKEQNGALVFTDQDGNRWAASEETTEVSPYLTRNIVKLSDVQEGSRCLIWPGDAVGLSLPPLYQAKKVIVFS